MLTEKYFSASGNNFQFFCQKKQFFRIAKTYFSMNVLFLVVETNFLASTNNKLLKKDFLFTENRLLYSRVLSYWPKPWLK